MNIYEWKSLAHYCGQGNKYDGFRELIECYVVPGPGVNLRANQMLERKSCCPIQSSYGA